MRIIGIIFFLLINGITSFSQDTIISISYKTFYSPNDYYPSTGFGIISYFDSKKFAVSTEMKLSYSFIDLNGGLEFIYRPIVINDNAVYSNPDSGPNGSYSNETKTTKIKYKEYRSNLILKMGADAKINLFNKFLSLKPGVNFGYSFNLRSNIVNDEYYYKRSWSYYNGLDSTYGGSTSETTSLASESQVKTNKNSLFLDAKISLGNNNGKFKFAITSGIRNYFTYIYEYSGGYGFKGKYSRDKYWEFTVGYVISKIN